MTGPAMAGPGAVSIRPIDDDHPRPGSSSTWDDWGPKAPEAKDMAMERWLIEITAADGAVVPVGDLSAHAVWYGPTPGSRAMNIGISVAEPYRGRGIGSIAQRLLAELLHDRGVARVEASTDVDNIAEQRCLARAGFAFEGIIRRAQARKDGLHDLQGWAHIEGAP
ncbi:MAG: GNAT family N-acetyltransferase [Candidatus Nanopelagicales bacterium]